MNKLLFLIFAYSTSIQAEPTGLADLAAKLGDQNFEIREQTLEELRKQVANEARRDQSLQEIRKLWLAEKNPEIRARLFTVGRELFTQTEGALFGFRFQEIPPITVKGTKTACISVIEVVKDSPAEKAGLKQGDLIYGANKRFLGMGKSLEEILIFFKLLDPGKTHRLRVRRANEDLVIKVKPDTQPLTREDLSFLSKIYLGWLLAPPEEAG